MAASSQLQYVELSSLPQWRSLGEISAALEGAHLVVSSGKRMVSTERSGVRDEIPLQQIIDKIRALRPLHFYSVRYPFFTPEHRAYLPVVKKMKSLLEEAPRSSCEAFCARLTCWIGCCASCSCSPIYWEDMIIEDAENSEQAAKDMLDFINQDPEVREGKVSAEQALQAAEAFAAEIAQ
jgi:hypothetical protein